MALTKPNFDFYWFETNLYVKIPWIFIKEEWINNEWEKIYIIEVVTDFYTNENKDYHIKQELEVIKSVTLENCNIEYCYNELKKLDKFKDYLDI